MQRCLSGSENASNRSPCSPGVVLCMGPSAHTCTSNGPDLGYLHTGSQREVTGCASHHRQTFGNFLESGFPCHLLMRILMPKLKVQALDSGLPYPFTGLSLQEQ